jgi:hypothetical protein
METLKTRIRTNIIYGAIALLPVAVFAYIAFQLFGYVKKGFQVLNPYLGSSPYFETDTLASFRLLGFENQECCADIRHAAQSVIERFEVSRSPGPSRIINCTLHG